MDRSCALDSGAVVALTHQDELERDELAHPGVVIHFRQAFRNTADVVGENQDGDYVDGGACWHLPTVIQSNPELSHLKRCVIFDGHKCAS